jgi:hypothetical protein
MSEGASEAGAIGPHRDGEEPLADDAWHEKSDSAIVAVKPTNKALHSAAEQSTAELFAAEPVEPAAARA